MFCLLKAFNNNNISIPSLVGFSKRPRRITHFAFVGALAICVGLCGCGGAVTHYVQAGDLMLSATSISFGDVPVGQTVSSAISLVNQGAADIEVSQLEVSGGPFTVDSQIALPVRVPSGGTVSVNLKFDPSSTGSSDGQLTVATNSTAPTAMVRLHGNGTSALASLSCSSASMTGAGTDACTVTLRSAAPSGGQVVNLVSNNAAVSVPSTVTVPAKMTTAGFTATVQPVSSAQTAGLAASVAKNSVTFSIALNAVQSTLSVSNATLNFGAVAVGTAVTQSLTLASTGNAAVTVNSGSASGAGFTLIGASFPMTLNPGQSASLAVQFNPTAAATSSGQVVISSNSSTGSTTMVGLSGTGSSVLSALSCGTASYAGAGSDACTVSLNAAAPAGGLSISLSSNQAAVTVPSSVTVPAGSTSAGFTAAVSSVSTSEAVALTATLGNAAQAFHIQLNASTPTLSVSTAAVAFGNVIVGQTGTQSVTLSSMGTAPVTISSISVAGSLFNATGVTTPFTLNPGQTARLTATFSPQIAEPYNYTGVITIASNSSTNPSAVINMNGAGIAASTLSAISCGTASYTGAGTDACTLSLTGPAPSGGLAIALSSNNSSVTVPASVPVPGGATSAGFSATVSSVTSAQSVALTASSGTATQSFAIQLNASTSTLSVSTTTIPFGNVIVGQTGTQSVTLSSTGTAPVTISSISVVGSLFNATGVTAPFTLNPGQTAKLTATFSPQIPEPYNYTGVVTIASNSSTNPSAVINMNGAGIAASTLKTLSCGTASYAGAGTDACTVTLSGAVPAGGLAIALSSNNSAVMVPSSVSVAAGATSAAFSSSVTAVTTSQTATITATASGLSQTFAIQLGTAGGSLSINATSVPFGEIIANSTATQTITLTATGTSPVTVRGASIAGSGFSVSGTTFPVTLNPGQTANLSVVFAPLTAGSYTGQLTISSNCTGGSTGVSLSGTGDPHRVQLSWNTPSAGTDPVVGYNIYRATAGSSNYQLINSAEDSQTTYSDTTVVHATSYVYYVMSVDSLGAQSVASNTTTVTIP